MPNDPQPSPQTSHRPPPSQGPPVISTTRLGTGMCAPCPQPRPWSPARSGPSGAARPHPHRCCCTARAQPAPLPPSSTRQRCPTGSSGRDCPVRARLEPLASHAHGGCVRHARARVSRVGHAPQTPPACIRHEGSTGAHLEPTRRARVGVPARSDETETREARQRSQLIAPLLQRAVQGAHLCCPLKVRGASAAARGVGARLRAAFVPSLA